MKTLKKYNIYIFISTFTRNIIDIYSVVYLYQKGLSIRSILFIYSLVYFLGSIISYISLTIGNKIGYKYILILSSILTTISFYILRISNSIFLISLFLSLSIFTYHPIKHYYGINLLTKQKEVGNTLIYILISNTLSSYIVIKELSLTYIILISIISIIPALFIKKNNKVKITYPNRISKTKYFYFIFDQFKILFILLEPLYLYLIANTLSYVGFFNIILTISSVLSLYFISNKININKYYKYLNIIFTIFLLLKINIDNKNILLVIAIFEGILLKISELVSTINLYNSNNPKIGYLIISEIIFCLIRTMILSIFILFHLKLKTILYILVIGVFISSFLYQKKDSN